MNFKSQLVLILLQIFNFIYKYIPFLTIKRLLLICAGFKIGEKSYIHNAKFFHFGRLEVGNNSTINGGCYLDNRFKITIGNNVSIAHDTKIYTLGHDIDDKDFKAKGAEVTIEDYVCIFSNVLIMPGVKIGKGAVIFPGSIVTKNVNEYDVVGGNPAKFIKKRNQNLEYQLNYNYWFAQ